MAEAVYRAVRRVPRGRVASYGVIADAAGRPGAARAAGRALRMLDRADVPWWRVVSAKGEIRIPRSTHAAPLQRALLEEEGIRFDGAGRIDMHTFGWTPLGADDVD